MSCTYVYQTNCTNSGGGTSTNSPDDSEWEPNTTYGGNSTNTGNNGDTTTTSTPMDDPKPAWDEIDKCINGPVFGGDNTTIDAEILAQLNLSQLAQINNYLKENSCSEDAQKEAIEDILEIYILNCVSNLNTSNLSHLSFENLNTTANIIRNDGCNELNKKFIENAVNVLEEDPEANPFLGADCRSFEFAQPPGAFQKGCAVKDFNHTFYTAGVRPNGSPYYGEIDINTPKIYFTMPNMITNGQAANNTARAVTAAIKATDAYFFAKPDITKYQLKNFFNNILRAELLIFGGNYSFTVEPFPIPNPAPYMTSVIGISEPYDCN